MISATSLDGTWEFWPDLDRQLPTGPGGAFVPASERVAALGEPRPIAVPSPWQAAFDDLRLWAGTAWYERRFRVPPGPRPGRVLVRFGAVDYFATAWVNGRLAGEHEGGYLPFRFDVTGLLRAEESNTVTLRVLDVGRDDEDGPFPFSEIPHGKQSWYGPIGGPWQSVSVEARGPVFVAQVRVLDADPSSGAVTAHLDLDGDVETDVEVPWRILAPDGRLVADGVAYRDDPVIRGHVRGPLVWDVDAPNLYAIETEVAVGGAVVDRHRDGFGFRSVGVRDGRVTLNGRPVYLLGALDQDYWMPGIATPGRDAELETQARRARELGLNLLRCHIKVPDPRYLDVADRTGLLVWCEPPTWIRLSEAARRRVRDTIAGMVERDANHPSLIIRSVVNEDWGTDLTGDPEHRTWLRETVSWLRSIDPTRLVVDNSACPPSFHLSSDLNDYHLYRSVPEQMESWSRWTDRWVREPSGTFSPQHDDERTGAEPLVLSEFGIWGLPDPRTLVDEDGRAPWWFDTGRDHGDGVVLPKGVEDRFDEWDLASVFGSFDAFIRASQEHEFDGLKAQIEDLRWHGDIAGYVVTELTDVHWEANGLLDMLRRPKAFHGRFRSVNAPAVVIVRPERIRHRSGAEVVAHVRAIGEIGHVDGRIRWELEGFDLEGDAVSRERIVFTAPSVDQPTRTALRVRWVEDSGQTINESSAALWFFPTEDAAPDRHVTVTARWEDVAAIVASGGRGLVLIDDASALPQNLSIGVEPFADEDGTSSSIYGNGWLMSTGMEWVSPAIGRALGAGPRVDFAFEGMTPRFVLAGYGREAARDVLAGHFLGWLHRLRATIAAFSHGDGAGLICTFPIAAGVDERDPLARALLARLTSIAASPELHPSTRL